MSYQKKIYELPSDSKERTFMYDNDLPSLPLPKLSETLSLYLDSVEALVTEQEFLSTKKTVQNFENGIGRDLHETLLQRTKIQRNWLEKWWEDYAYLINRSPLVPDCSMVGSFTADECGWEYGPGKMNLFAARFSYHLICAWSLLRKERFRAVKVRDSKNGFINLSMSQYRRYFNSCQIPEPNLDKIVCHFKTEAEGDCPSHVIVIHKGRIYRLEPFYGDGSQITVAEWKYLLDTLTEDASKTNNRGDDVACLASDYRDYWANNSKYLINLNGNNEECLRQIEESIFVLNLDDDCPANKSEINQIILTGDLRCRWADKSLNIVFFNNGMSGNICNHSLFDGIVSITINDYVSILCSEYKIDWKETSIFVRPQIIKPKEIKFVIDSHIKKCINETWERLNNHKTKYLIHSLNFNYFGKDLIKQHNLHPDAFIQMALQLAYYKLYRIPAATYETANTRAFYNGRTETHRSCTKESVKWCKSMYDENATNIERSNLLRIAIKKHLELIKRAEKNAGCDRHLFGLSIVALENNIQTPEIFTDPSYIKSGGNGNFKLSTSLVGYTSISGGVMPMCQDGYGFFYNINPSKISIVLSVHRDSYETSAQKLYTNLSEALLEMEQLLNETAITNKSKL